MHAAVCVTEMNKFFTCLCVWFFMILLVIRVLGTIDDERGVKCLEKERLVLLKFKSELIDEYQRLSTWGIEADKKECCTWKGVLCDDLTNHVVGLNLQGPRTRDYNLTGFGSLVGSAPLRGNISSSLLELVDLKYLDLSANDFNGSQIPEFIGSLVKLQHLNLNSSNFGGRIPSRLGNLSTLRYLDASENWLLSAKDLYWVSSLRSLEYLDLSFVNLSKTTSWMQSVEKLTSLKALYLKSCQLSETFHNSLPLINASSSLSILDLSSNAMTTFSIINRFLNFSSRFSYIDFSFNNLQGRIPNAFGNMISLSHLRLNFNNLQGGIPIVLVNLTSLSHLDLSVNDLEGRIPYDLGNLISLTHLGLSENLLVGRIPIVLGNLTSLSHLDLSANNLEGRIPDSFGNLVSLTHLDLSKNLLAGRIPYVLGNLISLSHLDFSGNQLEGRIPHALGGLVSLSHLSLADNLLHGDIPLSFKNLSNLRTIDLSYNSLNGQLSLMMKSLWNSTMLETLDLTENKLWGSLPIVSRFSVLRELKLGSNELNGSFPDGSLRFPNLEVLDLSKNHIVGSLPDLSSCSSLRLLNLNDNKFNGNLNAQGIKHLSMLDIMDLGSNNLEGTINENHFFNKSHLRHLDISLNSNLTVNINSDWNPPFQLLTIKLASCTLGPNFPKWLQKQNKVVRLDISNAEISDSIPKWFWDNSQSVGFLNLSFNQIYGTLPHFSLRSIQFVIDLRSNNFSGSLPPFPTILDYVDLSRNKFSGSVNNICHTEWWNVLDLSNNVLSGELSEDCFKNMMTLTYLNLANNNFSGKIPSIFDPECHLSSLHLRNNSFSGDFPTPLRDCIGLKMIDIGENNFTGMVPRWIGEKLLSLRVLSLKSNRFSGTLPSSLCQLSEIQVLDISMNTISGTIPRCVNNLTSMISKQAGNDTEFVVYGYSTFFYDKAEIMWKGKEAEYLKGLVSLKAIDLSSNNFVGEIPVEITTLVGLFALNLSRNNLKGSIPRDIGQLELLNFLDLSQNNLSGSIPDTLSQLNHLGVLNLSFNNLSGRIPWITHMQTFSSSSYIGNPGLCGPPLLKPCPGDEIPNKRPMFNGNFNRNDQADDHKFITTGFYISMAVGFIVGFWGVFGTFCLNNSWRTKLFKMLETVIDWLYVRMAVSRNRLQRYFQR